VLCSSVRLHMKRETNVRSTYEIKVLRGKDYAFSCCEIGPRFQYVFCWLYRKSTEVTPQCWRYIYFMHVPCILYIVSISANSAQYIYIYMYIYFNNMCIIITPTCFYKFVSSSGSSKTHRQHQHKNIQIVFTATSTYCWYKLYCKIIYATCYQQQPRNYFKMIILIR